MTICIRPCRVEPVSGSKMSRYSKKMTAAPLERQAERRQGRKDSLGHLPPAPRRFLNGSITTRRATHRPGNSGAQGCRGRDDRRARRAKAAWASDGELAGAFDDCHATYILSRPVVSLAHRLRLRLANASVTTKTCRSNAASRRLDGAGSFGNLIATAPSRPGLSRDVKSRMLVDKRDSEGRRLPAPHAHNISSTIPSMACRSGQFVIQTLSARTPAGMEPGLVAAQRPIACVLKDVSRRGRSISLSKDRGGTQRA